MKYATHKTVLLCLLTSPCFVNAADYDLAIMMDDSHVESAFSYQTELLPQWSFDLKYDRQPLEHGVWLDTINQHAPIESVRVSASRVISTSSSQRLFAALQSSRHQDFDNTFLLLPTNAGNAAILGWQLGEPDSLNMALEFKYREVGEMDINTLMMGVQYAF